MPPPGEPVPSVSVVVPVYGNADTLPELYQRLCRTLEPELPSFEFVFVVDASPDGSGQVLEQLRTRDARVEILSLPSNQGQHRAVLSGLRTARGWWTVVMDADLQDPPEAVPLLLEAGGAGTPVVFAGRRGRYEPPLRLFTSRLFKRALARLTGVPPDAGLFVALERPVVDRVLELDGRRPFVTAMIGCSGYPMTSVPVVRAERPSGRSAYRFRDRVATAARAFAWVASWRLANLRR